MTLIQKGSDFRISWCSLKRKPGWGSLIIAALTSRPPPKCSYTRFVTQGMMVPLSLSLSLPYTRSPSPPLNTSLFRCVSINSHFDVLISFGRLMVTSEMVNTVVAELEVFQSTIQSNVLLLRACAWPHVHPLRTPSSHFSYHTLSFSYIRVYSRALLWWIMFGQRDKDVEDRGDTETKATLLWCRSVRM